MNADRKKEAARAAQDLDNIAKLRKFPPFANYYEPRLMAEMSRLRDKILTDRDLTKDQLWEERIKFMALFDELKFMVQDEATCRAMLEAVPREEFDEDNQPTAGE